MKNNKTEIIFLLDESGSMNSAKEDTINGFNEFIKDQQEISGDVKFTFIKFNDSYTIVTDGTPISEIRALNEHSYTPSFTTALLDAVGKAIDTVEQRHKIISVFDKPDKVLFVVLTDGWENQSKEYIGKHQVSDMVKKQRDQNKWEFLFLGADIDAWEGGQSIGINTTVGTSKSDMKRSLKGLSNYTASYRTDSMDSMTLDNFNLSSEELDFQMTQLKKK